MDPNLIVENPLTYHVPYSWQRVIFLVRLQIHPSAREKLCASFTAAHPYHADMAHSTFGKPGSSILYNRVSRRFQGFWLMSRRNLWNFPQPGVPPVFWGGVGFEFDVGKRQFT
ncbi:hypothetical protein BS47DRAFT_1355174, partial [Hydnum rufescens UP504]